MKMDWKTKCELKLFAIKMNMYMKISLIQTFINLKLFGNRKLKKIKIKYSDLIKNLEKSEEYVKVTDILTNVINNGEIQPDLCIAKSLENHMGELK